MMPTSRPQRCGFTLPLGATGMILRRAVREVEAEHIGPGLDHRGNDVNVSLAGPSVATIWWLSCGQCSLAGCLWCAVVPI